MVLGENSHVILFFDGNLTLFMSHRLTDAETSAPTTTKPSDYPHITYVLLQEASLSPSAMSIYDMDAKHVHLSLALVSFP
jgi:hypothetical protein